MLDQLNLYDISTLLDDLFDLVSQF